jgi:glycosyltransferase involved in cell wall biosynthesis
MAQAVPEPPSRETRRAGDAARPISCIVCAYNEAGRIRGILGAVHRHPALAQVIVVNDGSTDATLQLLGEYPDVRVISYGENHGKTYALSQGIGVATGDYLMLLDADLAGVTAADIQDLADPVLGGRVEVSMTLRRNSLALYRWIGLDFVSGERVIPARLLSGSAATMARLPRWGAEVFINQRIVEEDLAIAVVDWPKVNNIRKYTKLGRWRGMVAELEMIGDALRVLSVRGVVRQNLALLALARRGARSLREPRTAPDDLRRTMARRAVFWHERPSGRR